MTQQHEVMGLIHRTDRDLLSRLFYFGVSAVWIIGLSIQLARGGGSLKSVLLTSFPWAILLMAVSFFSVEGWHSSHFAFDQPVTTAAALVLAPVSAGLVGFLGALDPRELKGVISPRKAVFNRSQVGLFMYLGSWVAHGISSAPGMRPHILPLALLVSGLAVAMNYVLVGTAMSIEHGSSIRRVLGKLKLGAPQDYVLVLLAAPVLSAMLASLYDQTRAWALLAFLAPIIMGRQVLLRSEMFLEAARTSASRQKALSHLEHNLTEERSDERKLIAADLHDDVLQPLFKVSLMAHVLRSELETGRLLEMDDDLPQLVEAADLASSTLREVIGELRKPSLGVGGLSSAIVRLAREASSGSAKIHVEARGVEVGANEELAIYQIAKEAIRNAVLHSKAKNIWLELSPPPPSTRLVVRDDGIGFDLDQSAANHYGLAIMRERATAVGATLTIETEPGEGSCVVVSLRYDEN